MLLTDIAHGPGRALPFAEIGADAALARDVQARLLLAGLLDPPVDGVFGQISVWALGAFCAARGLAVGEGLSAALAGELLAAQPPPLDIAGAQPLAGRVAQAMQAERYWLSRHPDCRTIVYAEALNEDGTANAGAPNTFQDLRIVVRVDANGRPEILGRWQGTTEPSLYWTTHPQDRAGAARIAPGQYKAWVVGIHMAGRPQAHEALVQAAPISVYRDLRQDFRREGAPVSGIFGINQHWGFNLPADDAGQASAGCLVGRTDDGHRAFMAMVKADPRFAAASGYRFMTTVLPAGTV